MNAVRVTEPETSVLEKRLVDEGTLIDAFSTPLPPAELASRLAPRIAEHLERAAWWPDHEDRCSPRLGEFSSYSIGFKCRDFRTLYVRLESEPFCEATLEISSSEGDPELAASAPEAMKVMLLRRGFKPGGGRAGFVRAQPLQSEDDCRAAADVIAGLMTDCLGYDPGVRVSFKFDLQQRARAESVLDELSLGDVARLLRAEGLVVWQIDEPNGKPGWRTVDRPRFDVHPAYESPAGSGRYKGLRFWFKAKFTPAGAEAVLRQISGWYARGDLRACEDGTVMILQYVPIAGGVTVSFLNNQLRFWRAVLKHVVNVANAATTEEDDDE